MFVKLPEEVYDSLKKCTKENTSFKTSVYRVLLTSLVIKKSLKILRLSVLYAYLI